MIPEYSLIHMPVRIIPEYTVTGQRVCNSI